MVKSLYAKLLAAGEKAIDAVQLPFKVNAAKLEAQKEQNELESEIANLDVEISKKKTTFPVVMKDILDLQDKKALKMRRFENMKSLYAEMFETEVEIETEVKA